MSAKVTRRNLLEMAATGGAALSVAATAAKPALAQDTAPRGNPVGSSGQNDYDVFDLRDVVLQSGNDVVFDQNPKATPADVERLEDLIAKLTARIRRLEGEWIDQFGDIA